jgi:hypothetical protein
MSIKNIVLLTCFTLSSIIATAQTVTGQILDGTEDGEPLPFATVFLKILRQVRKQILMVIIHWNLSLERTL